MKEIIKTENLSKRYGDTLIVKGINLSVMERTIYGFCGPNGAGKSTTLKMLLGLVRPTEGEISLFGKKMTANFEAERFFDRKPVLLWASDRQGKSGDLTGAAEGAGRKCGKGIEDRAP